VAIDELGFLQDLIVKYRPRRFIEIGMASGLSTGFLARFLAENEGADLVSIDHDDSLSYDFPWLLGQKGATARHAIYGGQWRWLDRKQLGLSGPLRSMINRRLHHRA
jgi:predicted O-methyltransferase YrrM